MADAFGDAGPAPVAELAAADDVRVQDAAGRVGQVGLHTAVGDRFEVSRDAAEGSRRAGGAGEGVDPAGGLVPDLRAGGFEVGAPVGHVVELVGPDGVGDGGGVAAGLVVVVVRMVVGDGGDRVDGRAQEPEQVDLALGLRVWHVDDEIVAPGAADVREPDAGVARRAFDDGAAGAEVALLFGIPDDIQGGTIFDTAARVLEFGFAEDFTAGFVGESVQADERGVADGWFRAGEDVSRKSFVSGEGGGM